MKKLGRFKWIDIMKSISIILIIYGHVFSNDFAFNFLYSFHLAVFMFISGFLYKQSSNKDFLKKKIKTILIPYLFFGILNLVYYFLIERSFRNVNLSLFHALLGLFFGYYNYLSFNVHIWFLPFFFATLFIFNIISNFINVRFARIFYILLGCIYIFFVPIALPFSINRFDLLFYFSIGNLCNNCSAKHIMNKLNPFILLIIAFVSFSFVYLMNYFNLNNFGFSYLIGIVGIIMVFSISYLIQNIDNYFHLVGRMTLVILCTHGPIYRILIKLFSILLHISSELIRSSFICSSIIVVFTLLFCIFIYIFCERIIPWSIGKKSFDWRLK